MRPLSQKRSTQFISFFTVLAFSTSLLIFPYSARGQALLDLPAPGKMIQLSKVYTPALMEGITVHPENPFLFDFLISAGDSKLQTPQLKEESARLVKYFMASLTVPEQDLWVNLSPYEKNRIIPQEFGLTRMGRDLLAQDYILKELASSLMYPGEQLGKEFWQEVYKKADERYGTTQIPVNTFNKIWIIADSAKIYEHGNSAYVAQCKLKVLLEEDLLALHKNLQWIVGRQSISGTQAKNSSKVSAEVVRNIIVPAIEREVNEGTHFAMLRQVYQSLILATWYKMKLKNTLLGKIYIAQNKINGINDNSKSINQEIYKRYIKAYRKGVFNFIQDDPDPMSTTLIPRKYFAGGLNIAQGESQGQQVPLENIIQVVGDQTSGDFAQGAQSVIKNLGGKGRLFVVSTALDPSMRSQNDNAVRSQNVLPGRPPVIPQPYRDPVSHRGETSAEWDNPLLLGQFLLSVYNQALLQHPQSPLLPPLSLREISPGALEFFRHRGVNINEEKLLEALRDLRLRGVIEGGSTQLSADDEIYFDAAPRQLALWSRDVEFIRDDLERALKEEKRLSAQFGHAHNVEQGPLMKVLDEYGQYVQDDWQRITEAKAPVLIAFTLMDKQIQDEILDILVNAPRLKPLADDIALGFAADRLGLGWLLKHPEYQNIDVEAILAEFSTFKGGLARVLFYLTERMKKRGINVRVIEPWYRNKLTRNAEGKDVLVPMDYENKNDVTVPLKDLGPVRESEIIYGRQNRRVQRRDGFIGNGVPVTQLGDTGNLAPAVYLYNKPGLGAPRTMAEFSIWFAKAAADSVVMDAVQKLRAGNHKKTVLMVEDAQALLTYFFIKLFYVTKTPVLPPNLADKLTKEEQDLLVQDMMEAARGIRAIPTTHTFLNSGSFPLNEIIDLLKKEGIDEQYLHYGLRINEWGHLAWDLSSPGLRSSEKGTATGVAGIHAFLRQINEGVPIIGVANGDLIDKFGFSGKYFDETVQRLYPHFQGDFWELSPDMLTSEKLAAATEVGGIVKERGLVKEFNPSLPIIVMDQRATDEKGWDKVFTTANVLAWIKKGHVFALANEQPYQESKDIMDRRYRVQREVYDAIAQHPEEFEGHGEFVISPYDPEFQRKVLAAATFHLHAPKPGTGANEMTETNALRNGAINITPAYLEGMVQAGIYFRLPQKPLNQPLSAGEYKLGTTLVINGNTEEDWRYALARMLEIYNTNRQALLEAQLLSLKASRTISEDFTMADYLRLIAKAAKQPQSPLVAREINGEVDLMPGSTKIMIDGEGVNSSFGWPVAISRFYTEYGETGPQIIGSIMGTKLDPTSHDSYWKTLPNGMVALKHDLQGEDVSAIIWRPENWRDEEHKRADHNQTWAIVNDANTGRRYELNMDDRTGKVTMEIAVNLKTEDVISHKRGEIPEGLVTASFVLEGGNEITFKRKSRHDGTLIMEAAIPRDFQDSLRGRLQVTSGLWFKYGHPIEIEFRAGDTTKFGDDLLRRLKVIPRIKVTPYSLIHYNGHGALPNTIAALGRLQGRGERKFARLIFFTKTDGSGRVAEIDIEKGSGYLLEARADHAMARPPGGILLDPAYLKMQIQRFGTDGHFETVGHSLPAGPLPPDFEILPGINFGQFQGFHLQLLKIAPVSQQRLQSLLGLGPVKQPSTSVSRELS